MTPSTSASTPAAGSASAAGPDTERRRARRARIVVWSVFLLALAASVVLRWSRIDDAAAEIGREADAIATSLAQGDTPAAIVDARAAALYGEDETRAAVDNYAELVRGLAQTLAPGAADHDPGAFRAEVTEQLRWLAVLAVGIQAAILLILPTMYHIRASRALRHLEFMRRGDPEQRTFWNHVWLQRHQHFLEEEGEQLVFWRRLGFALLVSLSSLYLLAPAGLQASTVGDYSRLHAPPGSLSYPFWFTEFRQASPFVLGFSGYLLYSLTVFSRRALASDVSQRVFISLWNRGITVVVLSLVLTGIDEGSDLSRALVFVAGVFPQTGIQAIGRLAQTGADQLKGLGPRGFADLPEIDTFKESSLNELDITSTADLANTDLHWLLGASGVDPRVLLGACDRALLLRMFGPDLCARLAGLPVRTASELLLFVEGADAYRARWRGGTARALAPVLQKAEKAARLADVCTVLGVKDLSGPVAELAGNRNVAVVLDNKVWYHDL